MNRKYRNIFFDLDNTLWDFKSNSKIALSMTFDKLNITSQLNSFDDYYKIYTRINDNFWELYRLGKTTKKILRTQRFEQSLEEYGHPNPGMGESINSEYMNQMPGQTKLIDGAIELLEGIHQKYNLHIITNGFREVQHKKIQTSGLSKYFDKIFISEEIGAPKPHKTIFEHAIKSANARKKESLMIGDSWEADIIGARHFGIDQVHFDPTDKNAKNLISAPSGRPSNNHQPFTPTYTISNLCELKSIL